MALLIGTAGGAEVDINNPLVRTLAREASMVTELSTRRITLLTSLRPIDRPEGYGVKYERKWVDNRPAPEQDQQWECLAEALYFEARGEPIRGQFAVARLF